MEAGLGQVQEKDAEIKRLQREIQTLRVCDVYLPVSSSLGLKQPVSTSHCGMTFRTSLMQDGEELSKKVKWLETEVSAVPLTRTSSYTARGVVHFVSCVCS